MTFQNDCPICGTGLQMYVDYEIGDYVECGDCDSEFEVVWSDPLTISEALEEEEVWVE